MSESPKKALLTKRDTAEILGVSIRTLDRWHQAGEGPRRVYIGGGRGMYPRAALDQFIESLSEA